MPREEWFVLKAKRANVSARELGRQYGLETLLDYFHRSRQHLNKVRGFDFTQRYKAHP